MRDSIRRNFCSSSRHIHSVTEVCSITPPLSLEYHFPNAPGLHTPSVEQVFATDSVITSNVALPDRSAELFLISEGPLRPLPL